jgi:hypothetical protein
LLVGLVLEADAAERIVLTIASSAVCEIAMRTTIV